MFIRRLPHHAQSNLHLDHNRPPCLSFAFAMILTMNARQFQRTRLLSGMGYSLNASNDIDTGVSDLAPTGGSVMDAVCAAVVGSSRTGRVLDAGSDREDRSSGVRSHSPKKTTTTSCTVIISAESCHIAT